MAKKLAPLTGVLFFLVLLVAVLIGGNSLSATSSAAKVLAHFQAHRHVVQASAVLTVISVFVGVIFYGQLRDYLRRHDGSRGLTATAFGGALLFAASGGLSAGVGLALTDSPSHLSPASAQTLFLVNQDVGTGLAGGGIAVLFFCFGWAIVTSGLLPKWLGWVAFPLALIALFPPLGFVALVGAGLWTLIASISMWRRVGSTDATADVAVASA